MNTSSVPDPSSVVVTSNPSPIPSAGTSVELICTVELGPAISQSDLSLLMVDAQLSRDGTPLDRTGPVISGTTFTYTVQLDSFEMSDVGDYSCTATVSLVSNSTFISGSGTANGMSTISIGTDTMCV